MRPVELLAAAPDGNPFGLPVVIVALVVALVLGWFCHGWFWDFAAWMEEQAAIAAARTVAFLATVGGVAIVCGLIFAMTLLSKVN